MGKSNVKHPQFEIPNGGLEYQILPFGSMIPGNSHRFKFGNVRGIRGLFVVAVLGLHEHRSHSPETEAPFTKYFDTTKTINIFNIFMP